MANNDSLTGDLRDLIAANQLVAIVGSGVSIAATGNASTASWAGLLRSGIDHCVQFAPGVSERWGQLRHELFDGALQDNDLLEILNVAEGICQRLDAPGGEFVRWLRASLSPDNLPLRDDRVIRALDSLHIPIVTTNYDELIEQVTGLSGVTWRERHKISRIVRGTDRDL